MRELRKRGHTCPHGEIFHPQPDADSTFLFDCRLWRAARYWASEMAHGGFFGHAHGGSNPCERTESFGLATCDENIAAGGTTPEQTLKKWMDSNGHCNNMMNPALNLFGIGDLSVEGSVWGRYQTQSMASTFKAADQSCITGVTYAPYVAPAPATPPPFVPAKHVGPCVETNPYCATTYKQYCLREDMPNIRDDCPVSCGLCTPTGNAASVAPAPGPAPPPPFAVSVAPAPAPAPPPPPPQAFLGICADQHDHCATTYLQYCNLEHMDHIRQECPVSCGLCSLKKSSTEGCNVVCKILALFGL